MRAARFRGLVAGVGSMAPAPGAFAAVMATGIVSVAALEHDCRVLSAVLAGIAVAALVVITALVVTRLVLGREPVSGSLRDPGVVLPLFGAVAACAVLAARFAAEHAAVVVLGSVGLVTWLALVPLAVRALRHRTLGDLRGRARGAWLLPAVATAGLVITAADLTVRGAALFGPATAGWVLSIALYAGAIALIAGRAVAMDMVGDLLAGDSWVVMGALAICTLAGDRMLRAAGPAHETGWLAWWLRPATLTCWVLATVLVGVLAIAHGHRLGRRAALPRHNVFWWAGVFPLGMYSVATRATAQQFHLRILPGVSELFCWLALLAWLVAALGLLHAAARHARASMPRTN